MHIIHVVINRDSFNTQEVPSLDNYLYQNLRGIKGWGKEKTGIGIVLVNRVWIEMSAYFVGDWVFKNP